jgi:hypothetical protein
VCVILCGLIDHVADMRRLRKVRLAIIWSCNVVARVVSVWVMTVQHLQCLDIAQCWGWGGSLRHFTNLGDLTWCAATARSSYGPLIDLQLCMHICIQVCL